MTPQGSPTRTVGARLREAREKRGVTLRQIANTTRISVMSLEALERSDLSRLPGGIFTRAFIRAYAQEVGLDPDRTIQDFIAELPPESAAATAHPAAVEDPEKLESDRKAVATAIRLVGVSLPIAGLVIYYGMHHRAPAVSAPPAAVETSDSTPAPSEPVATPSDPAAGRAGSPAARTPSSSEPPMPVRAAAPQTSGLTMEIAPTGDCWVSATADGEPTFSGLMHAGDKRQVSAREEISLNVGDAGAFTYKLNGKEGRPFGAPGEVVSKRIRVADLKDYVTP
ncbi:MAG TPA: RodZ domain-containing protein [Vicinamibacterales bacterium]|jgi:cytoskeletal protein RodZ|nr:RodZ domain-containing protein [Vicinamibacterales bacterium]